MDDRIELVQGDTGPPAEFHVLAVHPTAGASALDLTGATVWFRLRYQATTGSGAVATIAATIATSGSYGLALIPSWPTAVTATPGRYRGQLTCHLADGSTRTAPPGEPYVCVIRARV